MNEIIKLLDYIISSENKTCLKDEIKFKINKFYKKHPCYDYVNAMLMYGFKNKKEERHYYLTYYTLLENSAKKGCKEAQYIIANKLYDEKKYIDAILLYKKSADKGFAPSQWCYGIDTFNGIKNIYKRDIEEGLEYISYSAGQGYEYAIEFLIDIYSKGYNGIKKDTSKVKYYKKILDWEEK